MAGLRQRRGVLAVDHVDRLDEPKEHVHIHRVVRQGALQGTLSFVGMLLPLLAFRALFLPAHYWDVLPMALRCAAGPVGALVWNVGRLENFANGRQRWFIYSLRTLLALVGLIPVLILAPGFTHQVFPDWYTCQVTAVHVFVAVAIGLSAASLDYIWPWVCYKAGLIDSHDPPPSLTGEVISYNPYDDNAGGGMTWGNLLVLVRLVDIVLISPLLQALFFVRFCVEYISAVCAELRTDISGPISVAANSSTAVSTTSMPAGRHTNGTGDAASGGSALLVRKSDLFFIFNLIGIPSYSRSLLCDLNYYIKKTSLKFCREPIDFVILSQTRLSIHTHTHTHTYIGVRMKKDTISVILSF
jgi:hypothetical protein